MKYLFSFCFLVALTSVSAGKTVTFGRRIPNDILLYRENVFRFPKNGTVQQVYVTYPKSNTKMFHSGKVSAIYVYDRFTNSSGAFPMRIIPRLPATVRVVPTIIKLRSQFSRGINSTVEIYGKTFK